MLTLTSREECERGAGRRGQLRPAATASANHMFGLAKRAGHGGVVREWALAMKVAISICET